MADNVVTQSLELATPPAATTIATVEAAFSGDTVQAGVGVLAKSSGSEGSRSLTLVNPASEEKQDTGNTALAAILAALAPSIINTGVVSVTSGTLVDADGIGSSDDLFLDAVAIVNNSGTVVTVGIANGASQYLIAPFDLADKGSLVLPQYGRPITGLKWRGAAGVTMQAWGRS